VVSSVASAVESGAAHPDPLANGREEAGGDAMAAEINGFPLTNRKGLWFAEVTSKTYGTLEAVLDGSKDTPDPLQHEALRRFTAKIDENVNKLRSRLFLSFLFRPVRLSPNKKGKVGVQFQNILTGKKDKLVVE
jgi:hypothetical protein